jgi:hypothetical protein
MAKAKVCMLCQHEAHEPNICIEALCYCPHEKPLPIKVSPERRKKIKDRFLDLVREEEPTHPFLEDQ